MATKMIVKNQPSIQVFEIEEGIPIKRNYKKNDLQLKVIESIYCCSKNQSFLVPSTEILKVSKNERTFAASIIHALKKEPNPAIVSYSVVTDEKGIPSGVRFWRIG